MRRACLSKDTQIVNTDVNIYFFETENADIDLDKVTLSTLQRKLKYNLIRIDFNGDLSSFPKDFFDQTRQDLLEIIKLHRENG